MPRRGHPHDIEWDRALVEHWDGTRWSIDSIPVPGGATSPSLWGVSCPEQDKLLRRR